MIIVHKFNAAENGAAIIFTDWNENEIKWKKIKFDKKRTTQAARIVWSV